MSIQQPDDLFHAVVTLVSGFPLNVTILVYTQNQSVPMYVAWFHENNHINITVYKDGDKWIEKSIEQETVNSKAIGIAIDNSQFYKTKH